MLGSNSTPALALVTRSPEGGGMTTTFKFRVNGRDEMTMESETGIYVSAAAAIPAMFGIEDYPLDIEIWSPKVVDAVTLPSGDVIRGYGPYHYTIKEPGAAVLHLLPPPPLDGGGAG